METKTSYNFSTIKRSDLNQIVNLRSGADEHKFEEWFKIVYKFRPSETLFLKNLIKKYKYRLSAYLEETLKAKFIIVILDKVDFVTDTMQDWYDANIVGMVNGIELKGFADMVVAKGISEPEKPYFFIQEFKPSTPDRDPEVQLLAEMLVAIEQNQVKIMRGGYIIGRNWVFVIVEKIGENQFEYFISKSFDSLELSGLKQIYVNLQAVKHNYCKD